jgi:6-pyruvoyl-tetrahydropterin synthase
MAILADVIRGTKQDYNYVFPYGKHKGKLITEVLEEDPEYIIWASANITKFNPTAEVLAEARLYCD